MIARSKNTAYLSTLFLLYGSLLCCLLSPYLDSPFVADDFFFCLNHYDFSFIHHFLETWGHPLVGNVDGYRPLVTLSYALHTTILGETSAAFRMFNISIQILNATLVAALVLKLTEGRRLAFLAGLLFLVQPIQHEVVLWISGRPAAIATLFILTTNLLIVHLPSTGMRRKIATLGIFLTSSAAYLSYESAIVLPLLVAALVFIKGVNGSRMSPILTTVASAVAYLVVRSFLLTPSADLSSLVASDRIAFNLMSFFLRQLLLLGQTDGLFGIATLFPLILIVLGNAFLTKFPKASNARSLQALGGLWMGLSFLPYLTYSSFADRYVYLSSVGLVFLLAAPAASRSFQKASITSSLLIALSLLWANQLYHLGGEWAEAGRLAALVTRKFQEAVPRGSKELIAVSGIPQRYKNAYVLPTYAELAIMRDLKEPSLEVLVNPTPKELERVETHFRWDKARQDFAIVPVHPSVN